MTTTERYPTAVFHYLMKTCINKMELGFFQRSTAIGQEAVNSKFQQGKSQLDDRKKKIHHYGGQTVKQTPREAMESTLLDIP